MNGERPSSVRRSLKRRGKGVYSSHYRPETRKIQSAFRDSDELLMSKCVLRF